MRSIYLKSHNEKCELNIYRNKQKQSITQNSERCRRKFDKRIKQ